MIGHKEPRPELTKVISLKDHSSNGGSFNFYSAKHLVVNDSAFESLIAVFLNIA